MGHPMQGGAHQEALMELARENLMLKHQLKEASLELARLRCLCDKYQVQHQAQENVDKSRTSQSRYWTQDEHHRCMDAIQKFGHKDAKGIASFVGSRNATQVRTHVQKYYMRLARSNPNVASNSLKKSARNHGGSASEIGEDLQGLNGLYQPLAAHQQRLLQAGEAAYKKKHEEATSELPSDVKSKVALNTTRGQGSADEDRGDQSPSSCSTGSERLSSTTTQENGHGSSESNASNKSHSDRAASPASGPSNVVLNTENGSPDSACGGRANSSTGSDNAVFDVTHGQELFDCS